eukprot:848387-Rhodomonas_salina.1
MLILYAEELRTCGAGKAREYVLLDRLLELGGFGEGGAVVDLARGRMRSLLYAEMLTVGRI